MGRIGRPPGRSDGGIKVDWHCLVPESGRALENGNGARCGSRSGFRGSRGARARHDLTGSEPAARASLLENWAAVDRLLDLAARRPPARLSGRPGVHPPSATLRQRTSVPSGTHLQRIAPGRDASTSRGSCTQCTSVWSRKLPDGGDRLPRSVWHRRRHHRSGRLGCCSTLECSNCATVRASCP